MFWFHIHILAQCFFLLNLLGNHIEVMVSHQQNHHLLRMFFVIFRKINWSYTSSIFKWFDFDFDFSSVLHLY
ncbi:hypothetical protein GLOIN_2v1721536 [Rhizophagus irregularis DAOM 181602=DAOM 197198]|uniref:Uncharacterized protein n=1 Tax=Rhizophagus irregularis (strain DAOM 181602 / DAOM 197198 / MUCL 43194) TaxID=747089 RepID=A0A2P4P2A1_RHIID|nr:hypothetical protein GLOIN_2v1721536 [Rhizophagus irregularis DAOM 181602=DAOM 197198]POG59507.1 hypothetical protein GLOIN_2v1721536 [Rhizophagus irregularis DAOM 181602=DAOM 197198]|eukprot:XP_025166373.1 hypothetical protein GLOIN_2v1721536 [Rhizophagus irregularis DAOM 181602=DAOM 197198]